MTPEERAFVDPANWREDPPGTWTNVHARYKPITGQEWTCCKEHSDCFQCDKGPSAWDLELIRRRENLHQYAEC